MEPIKAEQLNGKIHTISGEEIETFTNQIRGEVITQRNEKYEEGRSIYNAMIDKKPALIVYCSISNSPKCQPLIPRCTCTL